jgi:dihydroorotase
MADPAGRPFVIKGATVLDASGRRRADVAVDGELIAAVGDDLDGDTVLDAGGCVLTTGLVDLACGTGAPGREESDTMATLSRAAALGGYTTLVTRADTVPVVDSAAAAREVLALAAGACCRIVPAATVTAGSAGERLTPMAELAELGVRLFCDDGVGVSDAGLLRRALEYASDLGLVVAQFAQDARLAGGGHMHEGCWSSRLGIAGIPAEAEEVVVMRDLALARLTGAALHFRSLSTAASWAMVSSARRAGVRVTAEVSVPHLLLTHAACADFDPATKFQPPLRSDEDRAAIVGQLAGGRVDAVVAGHVPHSAEDKEVPFDEAAHGASMLEWSLALALTELTLTEAHGARAPAAGRPVGLAELLAALSWKPASILGGTGGGRVEPGRPADLTVIDPTATWAVEPSRGASRSRSTPFAGRALRGRVRHTICRGERLVVDAEAQR